MTLYDPYTQAGVDRMWVQNEIAKLAHRTPTSSDTLAGIGGFCSLIALPSGYSKPILAAATDGVGTKFLLAKTTQDHYHIGIDVVAMCVNDLITSGASPLFFQDYVAFSQLDSTTLQSLFSGITHACGICDMALVGGETAQMPGVLQNGHYELAGTAVGVVEEACILGAHQVQPDDLLLGIASSGLHANGFSLVRQLLDGHEPTAIPLNGTTLHEMLLTPTLLYAPLIKTLLKTIKVHALSHITGGGIHENLPRILPVGMHYELTQSWPRPIIFDWIQKEGHFNDETMLSIFNCGVGMIAVIDKNDLHHALQCIKAQHYHGFLMGRLIP